MKLYKYLFNDVVEELTASETRNYIMDDYRHNAIYREGYFYIYDNGKSNGVILDMDYNGDYGTYHVYRNKMIPLLRDNIINNILDNETI